ncbi:glycosyltransferase [Noviherbaspirillum agri]
MAIKIKTFHIIGSKELGGAESFFVRLVEALTKAGHETIAITRPGAPVSTLLSSDVTQLHLPFASKWDLWSRWQLSRLIAKHQPDIVQTYMSRASRLTRLPAGSNAVHVARLGGYYSIPGNYDHAEAWVGNTQDICDYLVKQGLPAERIFYIGNFVPKPRDVSGDELAKVRQSLQLPDNAFVVFALGRMIEKKGFHDLIEAFSKLPDTHRGRPLMLVLAGDGAERAKYEALAQQLNVSQRVRFAGWQADPAPYFRLADLFVCPSRHEPLGNVILEAWTNGLPVLSTRNEGAQQLIDPGKNALLVPIADPDAMADGLRKMLALSDSELQTLVDEGHMAANAHSEEAVVKAYVELYAELKRSKTEDRQLGAAAA